MGLLKTFHMRISVKEGKIKSGTKKVTAEGKEYPASLDYFNIEDFPELLNAYGEKPTRMVVYLPAKDIEDFYFEKFALYNRANELVRSCDGEVCTHRTSEEICGDQYGAGEQGECICKLYEDQECFEKKKCRFVAQLKVLIGVPPDFKVKSTDCYMFETGSINSGINIKSELFKMAQLTGGNIGGLPFAINVRMVSGKTNAKMKFPIWDFRSLVDLADLKKRLEAAGAKLLTDQLMLPSANVDQAQEPAAAATPGVDLPPNYEPEEMMDSEFSEVERLLTLDRATEWVAKWTGTLRKLPPDKQKAWRDRYKAALDKISQSEKKDPGLFQ